MNLKGSQVIEGIDFVYTAGMEETHVHVSDISTMRYPKKQTVFVMKN
jgi:hypothetical protein